MIPVSPFRSRKKETGKIREPGPDWVDADYSKLRSRAARLHRAADELFPPS